MASLVAGCGSACGPSPSTSPGHVLEPTPSNEETPSEVEQLPPGPVRSEDHAYRIAAHHLLFEMGMSFPYSPEIRVEERHARWIVEWRRPEGVENYPEYVINIDRQTGAVICRGLPDCPYAFHCSALDGPCVEAECHPADPTHRLAERRCQTGYTCEWEDASGAYHGVGYCVPHSDPGHVHPAVERVTPDSW